MSAHFTPAPGGWWLSTPYFDSDFVAELKRLPCQLRKWNKGRACWWIDEAALFRARRIAESYYGPEHPAPRREDDADPRRASFATLCLLPTAPAALVKVAYRTLSMLNHPDLHGGDGQRQIELNRAYEVLKRDLVSV